MDYKKVSIIIPIFNVSLYLSECVDSVLQQTYGDFECILVDDGSTDDSSTICDSYQEKDSRIRVIHKMNGGLSSARNAGLKMATGDYVFFLDGDDWIIPDTIEVMVKIACETTSKIVQTKICRASSHYYPVYSGECATVHIDRMDCLRKIAQNDSEYISVCNKLYSIDVWKELSFPEGLLFEDMYVNYLIYYNADRIELCDREMYFYRQREGSICKSNSEYIDNDYYSAIDGRMEFYYKNGMDELVLDEKVFHMDFYPNQWKYEKDKKIRRKIKKKFNKEARDLFLNGRRLRLAWITFYISPRIYWYILSCKS